MRFYVAGPIAGNPHARELFAATAAGIRAAGHDVVNPFDVPPHEHDGDCPPGYAAGEALGHTSACHMRADITVLLTCDAVYAMRGWKASRGANVEVAVAKACGMTIIYAEPVDGETVHVPRRHRVGAF